MKPIPPACVALGCCLFAAVLTACRSTHPGGEEPIRSAARLSVRSDSFAEGSSIPDVFTGNGSNRSPSLAWSGAPSNAKSAFVLVEDPDAPQSTPFVHWMVADLPPNGHLSEGRKPGGIEGTNDFGTVGYAGPKPPPGSIHHYHFRVFALDARLDVPNGFSRAEALAAVRSHMVAQGECTGTYDAH